MGPTLKTAAKEARAGFSRLTSVRFVVSIIFLHFSVVIVSDTTCTLNVDRIELLIVCQSLLIVWDLVNSACFIYSRSREVSKTFDVRNKISTRNIEAEKVL